MRERILSKAHEYFRPFPEPHTKTQRRFIFGATDALLDASEIARSYKRCIGGDWAANVLASYGFLQALYVQQDAVWNLCKAFNLNWKPNDVTRLAEIREIRNRLCGHPASMDNANLASSAIISRDDFTNSSFCAHVYYDDKFSNIIVDVERFLSDNENELAKQLSVVETEMDRLEKVFRQEQARSPLSNIVGDRDRYTLDCIYCNLTDLGRVRQAEAHIQMFQRRLSQLRQELEDRKLAESFGLESIYCAEIGLVIISDIIARNGKVNDVQRRLDIVYEWFRKYADTVINSVHDVDKKLSSAV